MKRKVPQSLIGPADVAACLEELQQFLATVQKGRLTQRAGAKDKTAPVVLSDAVLELLGENPTDKTLNEAIAFIEDLQQAPVFHVTAVAELPADGQRKVAQWLRTNCNSQALVAFTANRNIAGGVMVRTPFHLHDYSFATQLEASRPALLKELAHV